MNAAKKNTNTHLHHTHTRSTFINHMNTHLQHTNRLCYAHSHTFFYTSHRSRTTNTHTHLSPHNTHTIHTSDYVDTCTPTDIHLLGCSFHFSLCRSSVSCSIILACGICYVNGQGCCEPHAATGPADHGFDGWIGIKGDDVADSRRSLAGTDPSSRDGDPTVANGSDNSDTSTPCRHSELSDRGG